MPLSRKWRVRLIGYPLFLGGLYLIGGWLLLNPAPKSKLPVVALGASPENLKRVVTSLAAIPRSANEAEGQRRAAAHLRLEWGKLGVAVETQAFKTIIGDLENLRVFFGPSRGPRLVIGAHYDTCGNQPGADDNASGVAGVTELIRLLKAHAGNLNRRVELVAYATEEPPFFATEEMGSAFHARTLKKEGAEIDLMVSLEMIGFFSDAPNSQRYPMPGLSLYYPSKGNFIAVVGQAGARALVRNVTSALNRTGRIGVYSINAPASVPGVDLSDHRNYWAEGYPAVMITDTASFRNANYHTAGDRPETLDYEKMAAVVDGVFGLITDWRSGTGDGN